MKTQPFPVELGEIVPFKLFDRYEIITGIRALINLSHARAVSAGWWSDIQTGQPKERNVGELLMLMVSEISEGFEGCRKNLMDDKLPHRLMIEVELADLLIRVSDFAGRYGLDVGAAICEKIDFNAKRPDHKIENRAGENGKKF